MFKERLIEAMELRGFNAVDICERLAIPASTMSNYMTGRMTPKTKRIMALASLLDVSEAWLLGYDVPMERNAESKKQEINRIFDLLTEQQKDSALQFLKSIVGERLGKDPLPPA